MKFFCLLVLLAFQATIASNDFGEKDTKIKFLMETEWSGEPLGTWEVTYNPAYQARRLEIQMCNCECSDLDYKEFEVTLERPGHKEVCKLNINMDLFLESKGIAYMCEDKIVSSKVAPVIKISYKGSEIIPKSVLTHISLELRNDEQESSFVTLHIESYPKNLFSKADLYGDIYLPKMTLTAEPSVFVLDESRWGKENEHGRLVVSLPESLSIVKIDVYTKIREGVKEKGLNSFILSTHQYDQKKFFEEWRNSQSLPGQLKQIEYKSPSGLVELNGYARSFELWGKVEPANMIALYSLNGDFNSQNISVLQLYVLKDNVIKIVDIPLTNGISGLEVAPSEITEPKIDLETLTNTWVIDFGSPIYLQSIVMTSILPAPVSVTRTTIELFTSNDKRLTVRGYPKGVIDAYFDITDSLYTELYPLLYSYSSTELGPGTKEFTLRGAPIKIRYLVFRNTLLPMSPFLVSQLEFNIIKQFNDDGTYDIKKSILLPKELLTVATTTLRTTTPTPAPIYTPSPPQINEIVKFFEIPYLETKVKYVNVSRYGQYVVTHKIQVYLSPTDDVKGYVNWVRCSMEDTAHVAENGEATLSCDKKVGGTQYLVFRSSSLKELPSVNMEVQFLDPERVLVVNFELVLTVYKPYFTPDPAYTIQFVELPVISEYVKFIKTDIGDFIKESQAHLYLSPNNDANRNQEWVWCKLSKESRSKEVELECEREVKYIKYLVLRYSSQKLLTTTHLQITLLTSARIEIVSVQVSLQVTYNPLPSPPSTNDQLQYVDLPFLRDQVKYLKTNIGNLIIEYNIVVYLSPSKDTEIYQDWVRCHAPTRAVTNSGEVTLVCDKEVSGTLFLLFKYSKSQAIPNTEFEVLIINSEMITIVTVQVEFMKQSGSNMWVTVPFPNGMTFNQLNLVVHDMGDVSQKSYFNVFTSSKKVNTADLSNRNANECQFIAQSSSQVTPYQLEAKDKPFSYVCGDSSPASVSFLYISLNAEYFMNYKFIIVGINLYTFQQPTPVFSSRMNITITVQKSSEIEAIESTVNELSYVLLSLSDYVKLTQIDAALTSGQINPRYLMVFVTPEKMTQQKVENSLKYNSYVSDLSSDKALSTISHENTLGAQCVSNKTGDNKATFTCPPKSNAEVLSIIFVFNSTQYSNDFLQKNKDYSEGENIIANGMYDLEAYDGNRKLFMFRYTLNYVYESTRVSRGDSVETWTYSGSSGSYVGGSTQPGGGSGGSGGISGGSGGGSWSSGGGSGGSGGISGGSGGGSGGSGGGSSSYEESSSSSTSYGGSSGSYGESSSSYGASSGGQEESFLNV